MQQKVVHAWVTIDRAVKSAAAIENEALCAAKLQLCFEGKMRLATDFVCNPPLDAVLGSCNQLVYDLKVKMGAGRVEGEQAGVQLHSCHAVLPSTPC